jgi:nucleotide-binding universal stress UspA family protein
VERIVVGVDGSVGARSALRWAAEQARLTGAALEPVLVHPYAEMATVEDAAPAIPGRVHEELRSEAEDRLRDALKDADLDVDGIDVRPHVIEGRPADRLLSIAHGADLLVVGTRGLGGFRGLLLGSVSHQLVSHATCAVVIVPETATYSATEEVML